MSISPSKYSWLVQQYTLLTIFTMDTRRTDANTHNYLIILSSYLPLPSLSNLCHISYKLLHYQTSTEAEAYKFSFYPKTTLDCNNFPASVANSL